MDLGHSRQSRGSQSHCGFCVICLYRDKYIILRYGTHMLNAVSCSRQSPDRWLCLEIWPSQTPQANPPLPPALRIRSPLNRGVVFHDLVGWMDHRIIES